MIGGAESHLSLLYESLTRIFHHDEWISREYLGGLNTYFLTGDLKELLETFEESCQMSFLVSSLLLSKLKESYTLADQSGSLLSLSRGEPILTNRKLMDLGDQITSLQRTMENETRRSALLKEPSVP